MAHRLPLFSNSSRRRFLHTLLALLTAALAFSGTLRAEPGAAGSTVSLVVDYGDGVEKRFTRLPWKKDMTVLDAMKAAQAGPHPIAFDFTRGGGPDTYFLTQLDGMKNEGFGSQKHNWLLWINGAPADRGFGASVLNPSDTATWRYAAGFPKSTNLPNPAVQ